MTDWTPLNTYVIVGPRGLEYVGLHKNEDDTWRVFLGWPTVGEVKWYKENGWAVYEASLTWRKNNE